MSKKAWVPKTLAVIGLHLDEKNPRLGRETSARAPREIIQYLFDHDKAIDIAQSIALRGFFPNEPLLVVKEGIRNIVVEGNRRLAALKALREPGLLEGKLARQVERLSKKISDIDSIAKVPIIVAPNRKATDRQIAGRHIGTPVLAWQAENRASFILDKLSEGYSVEELQDNLGFSTSDIQNARQTRAIADMARSMSLPEEIQAKFENPRVKLFTTIERVFESRVGRDFFHVEPNPDHGLRGKTTKSEFVRGFKKLLTDIATGKESSRSLNTNEDLRRYFEQWPAAERPKKKRGTFVPADVITGKSVASSAKTVSPTPTKKSKKLSLTVLPRDLKIRHGSDRLVDIHGELIKLKRADNPNAGAVLLRVFLELAIADYLKRTGDLQKLESELKNKYDKLPPLWPQLKQLVPSVIKIAKANLPAEEAKLVEKALTYNRAAAFTISEFHSFVHSGSDWPSDRDIQQFWQRLEPLFRMMLEQDIPSNNE